MFPSKDNTSSPTSDGKVVEPPTTPKNQLAPEDSGSPTSMSRQHFQAPLPTGHHERMIQHREAEGEGGVAQSVVWMGIAAEQKENDGHTELDIGFACHDGTYSIDFAVKWLSTDPDQPAESIDPDDNSEHAEKKPRLPEKAEDRPKVITDYIIKVVQLHGKRMLYKFAGIGLSPVINEMCPGLAPEIWMQLDAVPITPKRGDSDELRNAHSGLQMGVDEFADAMARACLSFFGPSGQPRMTLTWKGQVDPDVGGRARLTNEEMYREVSRQKTWSSAKHYQKLLQKSGHKSKAVRVAFFSATPQGGGVALMRHALIRFFRVMDVEFEWWVPQANQRVFRITKDNHNILQGVAAPDKRLSPEQEETIEDWIRENARRSWTNPGSGPLLPPSEGGADVIIVDDPQMPTIIDIAKELAPHRPVIFRSHIQIRADLANNPGTPTAGVWRWMWKSVQKADLFISHPVSVFVPAAVPEETLAYMPATTDWLDGLNKQLDEQNTEFYLHEFRTECHRQRQPTLAWPKRSYIIQVARFDPAKGIPGVLASYYKFIHQSKFCKGKKLDECPQLVICGHCSVDDPDGVGILNETNELLSTKYLDVRDNVICMRLGPVDQLLNALLSNAKVALQLSTREGFEVKVSEALHKGVPVITTKAGGIPLQVKDQKSGYLVDTGDSDAVAKHLDTLFSDQARCDEMSAYARKHVSDEVSTVGNAVCWMYLASELAAGRNPMPHGRFVWDMARAAAGEDVDPNEDQIPRYLITKRGK